jgi:hypothetical protein
LRQIIYKQWYRNQIPIEEVELIKHIDTIHGHYHHGSSFYECQVWECRRDNGEIITAKIRKKVIDPKMEKPEYIFDCITQGTDFLTCTLDECYSDNPHPETNPILKIMEADNENIINILNDIYKVEDNIFWKQVIHTYLKFVETPSITYAREWKELKQKRGVNLSTILKRYKISSVQYSKQEKSF